MAPKSKPEPGAPSAAKSPPDFAKAFPDAMVRDVENGAPILRPLREGDILDWRESDGTVVIVTVDGRKLEARK